ncbi:MAG: GntP family permease [Methylacidiphilales bacterium]|nr:GntP family permease [Candidatus Methylacidiphilales bacterium]
MNAVIILTALVFLMVVAYRGFSVILFAPVAALMAVFLTDTSAVPPLFTGLFMEKTAGFIKLYLPVFLLGAVFGKLIEISGFSRSIVASVIRTVGSQRAILSIVLVCALLTYGGVSLFVVVFAVYPFAAEMFRQGDIPKRLIPGTIALGAFSFTMDALPGSPQIQNIIPTSFFHTTTWAAPWLGVAGSIFIFVTGMGYLEWRRKSARTAGETYGAGHRNEPEVSLLGSPIPPIVALLPLVVVGVANSAFTWLIPKFYAATNETLLGGMTVPVVTQTEKVTAIWAVEGALSLGILTIVGFAFKAVAGKFTEASKSAVDGALMASVNTAAVYGFGAVVAALPGFVLIRNALKLIPNPLVNEAITVTALAGITGSASGGLGIALGSMADQFIAAAHTAGISPDVLHRVASMASGGMDTLPHNGAVITLLAVTGLTHRQSYRDIFAVTCIKTLSVFVVIALYYATGTV